MGRVSLVEILASPAAGIVAASVANYARATPPTAPARIRPSGLLGAGCINNPWLSRIAVTRPSTSRSKCSCVMPSHHFLLLEIPPDAWRAVNRNIKRGPMMATTGCRQTGT